MQFRCSQWLLEIGFGIGLLLLCSTGLKLAMQHSPEMPQLRSFDREGHDRHDSAAMHAVELARPISLLVNENL